MSNTRTFGKMPTKMPKGYYKAVYFPVLAELGVATGDHRMLNGDGGNVRPLPLTIKTQEATSYGHDGAMPAGALFEVTLDSAGGVASGRGFLADTEMGRKTGFYIETGIMRTNSIDTAEVEARYIEDMESGEYWIEFVKWALAATTIVATPAFANAHAEIDDTYDEVMASLLVDPMTPLVCSFSETKIVMPHEFDLVETVADGLPRVEHDAFFIPESATPHKIRTDGKRLWGHLGKWNTCHDGLPGCVMIPRPRDGYASFNKPGAFTEKGQIPTGPIFALGGHRSLIGKITDADKVASYGGIENAWADVRVTEGIHGPWISGHIRPGVDPNLAYAAVASRISGHWLGERLKAIVSVNSEGYDTGDDELVAGFEFSINDDGLTELVAGFLPSCEDETTVPVVDGVTAEQMAEIVAAVRAQLAAEGATELEATLETTADHDDDVILALLLEEDDH